MVESSVIEEELIEQSISDPISKSSLASINSSEDASCDSNIETETKECNDNNIQSEGASEIHCNSTVDEEQSEEKINEIEEGQSEEINDIEEGQSEEIINDIEEGQSEEIIDDVELDESLNDQEIAM